MGLYSGIIMRSSSIMGLYNNSGYNANNTGWWLTYPSEKSE